MIRAYCKYFRTRQRETLKASTSDGCQPNGLLWMDASDRDGSVAQESSATSKQCLATNCALTSSRRIGRDGLSRPCVCRQAILTAEVAFEGQGSDRKVPC